MYLLPSRHGHTQKDPATISTFRLERPKRKFTAKAPVGIQGGARQRLKRTIDA